MSFHVLLEGQCRKDGPWHGRLVRFIVPGSTDDAADYARSVLASGNAVTDEDGTRFEAKEIDQASLAGAWRPVTHDYARGRFTIDGMRVE
jgi:hypothetical protein